MAPSQISKKFLVLAAFSAIGEAYQPQPRAVWALSPSASRSQLGFVAGLQAFGSAPPLRSRSPSLLQMCVASDVSKDVATEIVAEGAAPAVPASNLGFNTYGDAFRLALSEVEVDVVDVAEERVDAQPDERKKKGVVSALGSGVVSALNTIFAGPSADQVQKNLEVFAATHKGSIGLAIEERASKRLVDLERLEKCFEKQLGEKNIDLFEP
jgi:hypothetical protein